MVSVGTNALLTNVSGNTAANMMPCRGFRGAHQGARRHTDPRQREPEEQHQSDRGEIAHDPTFGPEADQHADDPHDRDSQGRAHQIRERSPREDRRLRHRQRTESVDHPLLQVVREQDPGVDAGKRDRLDEDASHQEVDVRGVLAALASDIDGPAEDEAEQQHEHDRADRHIQEQLGSALDVNEVALDHLP